MNYLRISILLILITCFHSLLAQEKRIQIDKSKFNAGNLPAGVLSKIIPKLEKHLALYDSLATLIDPEDNEVTFNSRESFESLFSSPDSKVPLDYRELIVDYIEVEKYWDDVYSGRLRGYGVPSTISNATLLDVRNSGSNYYLVDISVVKKIFIYLTSDGNIERPSSGRDLTIIMRYYVGGSDFNNIRINRIDADLEPPDPYYSYAGIEFAGHLPFINLNPSDFWSQNHANSTLATTANYAYTVGIDYMTNRLAKRESTGKNLFLSLGFNYTRIGWTTQIRDFSFGGNGDGIDTLVSRERLNVQDTTIFDTLPYVRSVKELEVDERIRFHTFSIPVGLHARVKNFKWRDQDAYVFLSAKFVPIIRKSVSADIQGTGNYVACVKDSTGKVDLCSDWGNTINPQSIDDPNGWGPFRLGPRAINGTVNPSVTQFTFLTQLSPSVHIPLSSQGYKDIILMLGVDFTYQFSSMIVHTNGANDILLFNDDYRQGVLQHYTQGMSNLMVGLKAGLKYRIRVDP